MIKRKIKLGDILYDPFKHQTLEVVQFGTDFLGQTTIDYVIDEEMRSKKKALKTSAWIAFKFFTKLGRV